MVIKWSDSKSKSRICKINKTITVFHFMSNTWVTVATYYLSLLLFFIYYWNLSANILQFTVIKLFGRVIKVAWKSCVMLFHKNKAIITANGGGVSIQIDTLPNNEITWKLVYQANCIIRFMSPAWNEEWKMNNMNIKSKNQWQFWN